MNEALLLSISEKGQDDRERAYLLNVGLSGKDHRLASAALCRVRTRGSDDRIGRGIDTGSLSSVEKLERALCALVIDAEMTLSGAASPTFIPHSMYQYATGYAAATSISQAILKEYESATLATSIF